MRTGGLRRAALACAGLVLALVPLPAAAAQPDDVRVATVALAHEAADLLALNAYPAGEQTNALTMALQGLPLATPTAPAALRTKLKADDAAGAAALTRLQAGRAGLSREVGTALATLTPSQLSLVDRRALKDPAAGLYLKALEDLTVRNGAPTTTQGTRPDPEAVNAGLATALAAAPAAGTSSTSRWPWAVGAAVALAVVAWWFLRRPRRPQPIPAAVPAAPTQSGPAVHKVLEASRRLTSLTAEDDISRAIVREALSLVPARAAALITRERDALVVGHESQPGLLRPEGFGRGVVDTAAHAGRPIAQMLTEDASFARLPVQGLLLPLISTGRVDAVLVLVRDPMETFLPAERELLTTFAPIAAAARDSAAKTQAAVDASQIDPLTGAGNRRQLDTHVKAVLRDGIGGSTGFFMIDLDHFKSVNDSYGHPAGDAMLRQVCTTIRDAVRPTDGVYRYGGEEFCVLLPTTTLEETQDIAERVRAAIEAGTYDVGTGQPLPATASVGVASTSGTDGEALISQADRALYAAKTGGRNQVRSG